jgi:hypothetical protein
MHPTQITDINILIYNQETLIQRIEYQFAFSSVSPVAKRQPLRNKSAENAGFFRFFYEN